MKKDSSPFNLSLKEFLGLSEKEMEAVFDEVAKANKPFVEKYFQDNPDVDWIVIAFAPGNVIVYGEKSNEPMEEQLAQIAGEEGVPVFAYSRAGIIETVTLANS